MGRNSILWSLVSVGLLSFNGVHAMDSSWEHGAALGESKIHPGRPGLWSKATGYMKLVVERPKEKVWDYSENPADFQGEVVDACEMLIDACIKTKVRENEQSALDRQYALRDNAMGALQFALAAGKNVHKKNKKGQSPVHVLGSFFEGEVFYWAHYHVVAAAIKMLIQAGAHVKTEYVEDASLLHQAAKQGCDNLVAPLIQAKISVDVVNSYQQTPLSIATQFYWPGSCAQARSQRATIYRLLECKANPNYKDKEGNTPLHYANAPGVVLTSELLLSHKKMIIDLLEEYMNKK